MTFRQFIARTVVAAFAVVAVSALAWLIVLAVTDPVFGPVIKYVVGGWLLLQLFGWAWVNA